MIPHLVSFGSGALFAFGLSLSGMTQPAKVVGFLNVTGAWDPSLAFVMAGAVAVYAAAYRLRLRRQAPLCAPRFPDLSSRTIDGRLLVGAALFGAGWGLGGFCPGPGLASLGAGSSHAIVFVSAMLIGMFLVKTAERVARAREADADAVPQRSVS